MDPAHLEDEEYCIELEVRDISIRDPRAYDKLLLALKEENARIRSVPFKLHKQFVSVDSEIDEVGRRLVNVNPKAAIQSGDPVLICRVLSRLMHLRGRVVRLAFKTGRHVQVDRLGSDVNKAFDTCLSYVVNPDSAPTSLDGAVGGQPSPDQRQAEALLSVLHANKAQTATDTNQPTQSINTESTMRNQTAAELRSLPPSLQDLEPNQGVDVGRTNPEPSADWTSSGNANRGSMPRLRTDDSFVTVDRCSRVHQPENPPSQGWALSKCSLRFSGEPRDLPVEEFVFRLETLARFSNITPQSLALGLHQLLIGSASSWYWVFIRNEPYASWTRVKAALVASFQSNVSDMAIRRLIMDRLQRTSERFMEFCVAVQAMEVRLTVRMRDVELLDVLRRNMLPHMQDRLLFVPVDSVHQLQQRVQEIEELMQRQAEVQQIRRSGMRVSEIAELEIPQTSRPPVDVSFANPQPPIVLANTEWQSNRASVNPFSQPPPQLGSFGVEEQNEWVCAVDSTAVRGQFTICWNCDEMGHSFMDCTAPRIIFCYGCGAKNVVRPQCPKCSLQSLQGNGRRNARQILAPPQAPQMRESQVFQGRGRPQ